MTVGFLYASIVSMNDNPIFVTDNENSELSYRLTIAQKVQDLSLALLQIERGIDRKYLKAPLGM